MGALWVEMVRWARKCCRWLHTADDKNARHSRPSFLKRVFICLCLQILKMHKYFSSFVLSLKVNLFFFYSILRSSNQENICELQQPQDLISLKNECCLSFICDWIKGKGAVAEQRETDRDRRESAGVPAPPAVPMHSRTVDSIQPSSRQWYMSPDRN